MCSYLHHNCFWSTVAFLSECSIFVLVFVLAKGCPSFTENGQSCFLPAAGWMRAAGRTVERRLFIELVSRRICIGIVSFTFNLSHLTAERHQTGYVHDHIHTGALTEWLNNHMRHISRRDPEIVFSLVIWYFLYFFVVRFRTTMNNI